jgi:hypothetical protein
VYKILVAPKDAITKITGIITPKFMDTLENELGGAFTILKSTHLAEGQQYGYLACIISEEKYRIVIADPVWVYTALANSGAYAATALAAGVNTAQLEQIIAQHKETQAVYTEYLGAQDAGNKLLLYSIGNNALAPLKKQYINFNDVTNHFMIYHFQENMTIKMTTSQKFEFKAEGYRKQWDPTTSITAYFTSFDNFQTSLAIRGIATSIKEMTMAAGSRMQESKIFTEDQMVAWENKTAAQQTWQNLEDYFTEKWLERRQYLQATAKHLHFKDAALATQELAAKEEEGKTTVMMFTLLQEQHKMQLKVMVAFNNQVMDTMFECMNALIAGHSKAADKVNAPPANSNSGCASSSTKRNRKKCMNCGKHVLHKPEDCNELKTNASKRWPG